MPSKMLTPVDPSVMAGMPNTGPVPMPMKSPISIVLPKKGSALCRDDYFSFSWKADAKSVEQIRIWIEANIPAPPIADISISYNETGALGVGHYDWKVGSVQFTGQDMFIPDGDFYHIKYEVMNNGTTVYSGKSDSFSINTCKG